MDSFASTVDFSHLIFKNDSQLQDVITELGSTRFYRLSEINVDGNEAVRFCFQQSDTSESSADADQAVHYVTILNPINWLQLSELNSYFENNSLTAKMRFVQPSLNLQGFVQFKLLATLTQHQEEQLSSVLNQLQIKAISTCSNSVPKLNEPGLLVMDMDSTAIQIECIDEIAKLAGVGEQVAEVTAKAMRGELDFEQSLHARVATLKNADASIINQIADDLPLMPGLVNLVKTLKANNWRIAIVSGGFTAMTEKLRAQLSLDRTYANVLDVVDDKLTGTVSGQVIDAQAKADAVVSLAKEFGIPMSQTVAMGDGANDLKMMAAAQLGVAFHAKPLVQAQADVAFESGGLDQLLYLLDQKL